MLVLFGGDIGPVSSLHFIALSIFLLTGALVNAGVFGTISVILQSFNRKGQKYQQQIDILNTVMKKMNLDEDLKKKIRSFQ